MPAGSTACISLGETVSETGAPVAAQCDETRAVRPISAGNIKVSSAHRHTDGGRQFQRHTKSRAR